MPTHAERKNLPYTPEQLFDLVIDIDRYPEFLPWCIAARVNSRQDNEIYADLVIGYKMIREKFSSHVSFEKPDTIRVEYLDGPMRYLSNKWEFIRENDGSCTIDFYVDFEFKNAVLQKMMGLFFNEAVRRMVSSFETRASVLYGGCEKQKIDAGSNGSSTQTAN